MADRYLTLGTSLVDGSDFRLPIDAVTETFGVLGRKRSGKSNGMVVFAEETFDAGVPFVAVDPKGDWWGIRAGADGDPAGGLDVVVFGGRHGDLPLDSTDATAHLIADLVVDERLSCVLDVSEWSKAEVRRFLTPFALRLYHRNDLPIVVLIDEAHEILPQSVDGSDAALVGAWSKLVKQGGFRGIGVVMGSQRSATLNKNVLSQIDSLFVLRTTAPNDRKVVREWVDTAADDGSARSLVDGLPTLAAGEAWCWSPVLLEETTPLRFRRRRTFDSGATPKVGEARQVPKGLRDLDLDSVRTALAEVVERAEAEDPAKLRKRIARLEAELAERPAEVEVRTEEVRVEVPVLDVEKVEALLGEHRDRLDAIVTELGQPLAEIAGEVEVVLGLVRSGVEDFSERAAVASASPPPSPRPGRTPPAAPVRTPQPQEAAGEERPLTVSAEKILATAVGALPMQPTLGQLAALAGYSTKSSTWDKAIALLRRLDYVRLSGTVVVPTEYGVAASGVEVGSAPPTHEALVARWRDVLPPAAKALLVVLLGAVGPLDRERLFVGAGYSPTSSTPEKAISTLRRNGLVDEVEGGFVAGSALWP